MEPSLVAVAHEADEGPVQDWSAEAVGISRHHFDELQRLVQSWASEYELFLRQLAAKEVERMQRSRQMTPKQTANFVNEGNVCRCGFDAAKSRAEWAQPAASPICSTGNSPHLGHAEERLFSKDTCGSSDQVAETSESKLGRKSRFSALSFARRVSTAENESDFSSRSKLHRLVKSPIFEHIMATMILLSSILITAEVQYRATTKVDDDQIIFEALSAVFTFVFLIELLLRVLHKGIAFFSCFARGFIWNYFDIVFVVSGLVEFAFLIAGANGDSSNIVGALRIARLIRVARMIRVMRVVRTSPLFADLRILLHAILSAGGAMMWSIAVLCSVLFVVSCILTQAATNHRIANGEDPSSWACDKMDDFFGSVLLSLITMFLSVTGGVNWGEPFQCIASLHVVYGAVFFLTVSFCVVAMLNIVNGFFVESAMQAAHADREHKIAEVIKNKDKYLEELRRVFRHMDRDGSNAITYEEFQRCVERPQFRHYLEALDLDIDAGKDIFDLLDADKNGTVDLEEFVGGCMKFRGQATAMDVAGIRQEITRFGRRLTKALDERAPVTGRHLQSELTFTESAPRELGDMADWRPSLVTVGITSL